MRQSLLLILLSFFISAAALAQTYRVHGKITNDRLEALAFASIQVKNSKLGTTSREDGTYELLLDDGKYDLVVSMLGYKPQVITIIVGKEPYLINVILDEEDKNMSEVVIRGKFKDPSEEIIRNVIRHKDDITGAAGAWSADVYIKAIQEDSSSRKQKKKPGVIPDSLSTELARMAMAEVVLRLDHESSQHIREERTGITKKGNAESLFYLTVTDGDFDFYNNLIRVPAISVVPFVSPISYSGLLAYRFRLMKTETRGARKIYTISIRPRQLSNATVEGEVVIEDSAWVMLRTKFRFPSYHLAEYDFFEVAQEYEWVNDTAWMVTRQQFIYNSKSNKAKRSGETVAVFRNFRLNRVFPKKYFGTEVSATLQQAYEKDSSFWNANRTEPLTQKEVRFIRYKDSIYRATHTKAYLDSIDRKINRITWQKVLFQGQNFNYHEKQRHWFIPPIPSIYQPLQLGGARIRLSFFYSKTYKSRKNIFLNTDLSYGIRNKDVNGGVRLSRMYNPFNRGFYRVSVSRDFQYIFSGDAWINMLKRSNIYLNNGISVGQGLEIHNGLFLSTDVDMAFRKSVSNYKTNSDIDSLFPDLLNNNFAPAFKSYNAVYGKIRLQYTPFQRYIREPKEKIILGSAWPTIYVSLKKGVPGIFNSQTDFDYLEFGLEQQIRLGTMGISSYSVRTGDFLSRRDLRLVDYKYQRRGDPILFNNPAEAFQALDSSFPLFHRFYQAHYIHEFNGALLNRIPFLKKIGLREVGGGGFLMAPERHLRYVEAFAGIERVFKWPFNPDTKFKLGVYVVGSAANQYRNPVQVKVGITSWDKLNNKWN